jgi:hypothetical protein
MFFDNAKHTERIYGIGYPHEHQIVEEEREGGGMSPAPKRERGTASARLRSISFRMSLEGPRSRMVHTLEISHSARNVKYLETNE